MRQRLASPNGRIEHGRVSLASWPFRTPFRTAIRSIDSGLLVINRLEINNREQLVVQLSRFSINPLSPLFPWKRVFPWKLMLAHGGPVMDAIDFISEGALANATRSFAPWEDLEAEWRHHYQFLSVEAAIAPLWWRAYGGRRFRRRESHVNHSLRRLSDLYNGKQNEPVNQLQTTTQTK